MTTLSQNKPRSRATLVAAAGLFGVAACAGLQLPRPTAGDAERAAAQFPGVTVASLEAGRALYLSRCTRCHQAVAPSKHPPERWPAELAEMRQRAKLSAADEELLLRYLVVMSTPHDKDTNAATDPASPSARLSETETRK